MFNSLRSCFTAFVVLAAVPATSFAQQLPPGQIDALVKQVIEVCAPEPFVRPEMIVRFDSEACAIALIQLRALGNVPVVVNGASMTAEQFAQATFGALGSDMQVAVNTAIAQAANTRTAFAVSPGSPV